jgi:cobalt-zinc-cadmium efflux system protein
MSIGVAIFILLHAVRNLKEALDLFLEKAPQGVNPAEITAHLVDVEGVLDVHHVHLWSMDGQSNYATMHVVYSGDAQAVKSAVRGELKEHGIAHCTLELESAEEHCDEQTCRVENDAPSHSHHHHHHH